MGKTTASTRAVHDFSRFFWFWNIDFLREKKIASLIEVRHTGQRTMFSLLLIIERDAWCAAMEITNGFVVLECKCTGYLRRSKETLINVLFVITDIEERERERVNWLIVFLILTIFLIDWSAAAKQQQFNSMSIRFRSASLSYLVACSIQNAIFRKYFTPNIATKQSIEMKIILLNTYI